MTGNNRIDTAIRIIETALEEIKKEMPEQGDVRSECYQILLLTRQIEQKYIEQQAQPDEN